VVRRRLDWRAYGGRAGRTSGPPGARHVRLDDEGDTCATKNEVHRGRIHLGKRRSLSAEHRAAHDADAEVRARGRGHSWPVLVLLSLDLNTINYKILNRSAQNIEYESCRSHYPLQLSQRLYGVFLNRFCKKSFPTLNVNMCQ
jgi:hypothetical protein